MSRVLFAWELGGGYGHLGPFLPVARALLARGHEVTLAVRDVERANIVYGALPVHVVQAPICVKTYGGLAEPPLNYAEILMRYGYLDVPQLAGMLRAWRGLLALSRAEVLIADHAPSALLAARGAGVARIATGSPFTVPPQLSPTPNMRPWMEVPAARLASSDAMVLERINASLPAGVTKLARLASIFEGAEHLMGGVPELDHYGPRDPRQYLGFLGGDIGSVVPRWPAGGQPRVFAYLSGEYRHIEAVLDALAKSNVICLLSFRDAGANLREKYQSERLVFSEGLLDIDRVVSECDFCVCHGNFGTVAEALRRGKPVLALPMDLEKFLLAAIVEKGNLGRCVHPDAPNPDFAGAIRQMVDTPALAATAREFALRHREPSVDTIVERVTGRIEALARSAQARPE